MTDVDQVFWGLALRREDGDKLIVHRGYTAIGWPEAVTKDEARHAALQRLAMEAPQICESH